MKKFVAIVLALIMMIPTPVRAETVAVEPISSIEDILSTEGWDNLVMRCKVTQIDRTKEVLSTDQIVWLVQTLEKDRVESITENKPLDILLGIGIWEKDPEKFQMVENAIHKIVEAFEAKMGVSLKIAKKKGNDESYYFELRLRGIILGLPATVRKYGDGRYYESAWGAGSGRFGKIGNNYVSENDQVIPIKVAYLNEKNEVVEVVSEPGAVIDSERCMVLLQKGDTVLGWFYPYYLIQ